VEQAERSLAEAMAAGKNATHVNTQAFVLTYGGCLLESLRGDTRAIEVHLRNLFELADEHHLAMWRAYAMDFEGWMIGARSQPARGIALMQAGLDETRAMGTEAERPYLFGLLASLHALAGQTESAVCLLQDALHRASSGGEYWCEAELHRCSRRYSGCSAEPGIWT
jgi:predicted ATPase